MKPHWSRRYVRRPCPANLLRSTRPFRAPPPLRRLEVVAPAAAAAVGEVVGTSLLLGAPAPAVAAQRALYAELEGIDRRVVADEGDVALELLGRRAAPERRGVVRPRDRRRRAHLARGGGGGTADTRRVARETRGGVRDETRQRETQPLPAVTERTDRATRQRATRRASE